MALKIRQLLIIMQYLPNIGDNPVYTYRTCMYTSALMIDSTIVGVPLLLLYLLPLPHCLKKRMDTCNNSKDGG